MFRLPGLPTDASIVTPPPSPLFAAALIATLLPGALAQGYEVQELEGRWRLSLERLDADAAGDATVVGLHYELFDLFDSGWFAGLGGYGSVDGDIGNFFAAGLDFGWRQRLTETFSLQVGTFAGTSGGSITQGQEGFSWRPFIALEKNFSRFGLRLEAAQMNVAGADFDDPVFSLGVTVPMNWTTARERDAWASPIDIADLHFDRVSIGALATSLDATSGSKRLTGSSYEDDLLLGGLRAGLELSERSTLPIEAWGATGGGIGGYRMILVGYGLHGPLWESAVGDRLSWELEVLAGLGGGGQVDVGAGLVMKGLAGLRARVADNWTAQVWYSYLDAPDGNFTASGLQLGLAWDPRALRLADDYDRTQLADQALPAAEGLLDVWQLSVLSKVYDMRASSQPIGGGDYRVRQYLVGLGAERHMSDNVSLVARAFGPVAGDIGGYGEILGGVRISGTPFDFLGETDVYVEYGMGAAGGGDVDVGSGLVHQVTAGLTFPIARGVEVGVGLGRMNAFDKGSLDASVVEAGIAFDLTRILARR